MEIKINSEQAQDCIDLLQMLVTIGVGQFIVTVLILFRSMSNGN